MDKIIEDSLMDLVKKSLISSLADFDKKKLYVNLIIGGRTNSCIVGYTKSGEKVDLLRINFHIKD